MRKSDGGLFLLDNSVTYNKLKTDTFPPLFTGDLNLKPIVSGVSFSQTGHIKGYEPASVDLVISGNYFTEFTTVAVSGGPFSGATITERSLVSFPQTITVNCPVITASAVDVYPVTVTVSGWSQNVVFAAGDYTIALPYVNEKIKYSNGTRTSNLFYTAANGAQYDEEIYLPGATYGYSGANGPWAESSYTIAYPLTVQASVEVDMTENIPDTFCYFGLYNGARGSSSVWNMWAFFRAWNPGGLARSANTAAGGQVGFAYGTPARTVYKITVTPSQVKFYVNNVLFATVNTPVLSGLYFRFLDYADNGSTFAPVNIHSVRLFGEWV